MSHTDTLQHTISLGEDDIDVEIDCEFSAIPFVPAQTYGPPENCYPAEGGEIEDLTCTVTAATFFDGRKATADELKYVIQPAIDAQWDDLAPKIEEKLFERLSERDDYPEWDDE